MPEGSSITVLGDLSKPATVLIEKISDALGGAFKPFQIRRVAKAEADASKIKAVAEIEITDMQRRGLQRLVFEEGRNQENIENIARLALPQVNEKAKAEDVEKDWISNFFDKCRLISDEEMQNIWAGILSGEANAPGRFSKRTVNFISSLDKNDAVLFSKLCGFSWIIGSPTPLIYNVGAEIYKNHGINFSILNHLASIGLITFNHMSGYVRQELPKNITVAYQSIPLNIEFQKEEKNDLKLGKILLTSIGQELASIIQPEKIEGFYEYIVNHWSSNGLILSSPLHTVITK